MEWTRGPTIGRGSSATVSLATTSSGDIFAVKSTDLVRSNFLQREQRFLSQLSSPYVTSYMGFDVTSENNKPIYNLFMEYAPGGSISDMIKSQGGSLDESMIRSYTHQILLGLDCLHSNKLVHCDIKGQNILLGKDGVMIGDLGFAKLVEDDGCFASSSSAFAGTPVFMAPEVARGEEQGFPADVWALGCTVIEMATGYHPWPELDDPVSALYRIGYSGDQPEFPGWLCDEAKDFLSKCLKIDSNERWTVKELLQHPFVDNFGSNLKQAEKFVRNSPTSILDQGFWDSLEVSSEPSRDPTKIESCVNSPVDGIKKLMMGSQVEASLPNWTDDQEDWVTIRSNHIDHETAKINEQNSDTNVEEEEEEKELLTRIDSLYLSIVNSEELESSIIRIDYNDGDDLWLDRECPDSDSSSVVVVLGQISKSTCPVKVLVIFLYFLILTRKVIKILFLLNSLLVLKYCICFTTPHPLVHGFCDQNRFEKITDDDVLLKTLCSWLDGFDFVFDS